MGYNTTIMILNDRLGEIQDDPESFVNALVEAMAKAGTSGRVTPFFNGCQVVAQEHANVVTVITVGGNTGRTLHRSHNGGLHTTPDQRDEILRGLAAKYIRPMQPVMRVDCVNLVDCGYYEIMALDVDGEETWTTAKLDARLLERGWLVKPAYVCPVCAAER
jgi:hypothetical protein